MDHLVEVWGVEEAGGVMIDRVQKATERGESFSGLPCPLIEKGE